MTPAPGERLPAPAPRGLVVAAPRPESSGGAWTAYLPFVLTLLAGGIVVAIVALALGGPPRRVASGIPLPPPSVSATPAPSIGAASHHHGSAR